MIYLTMRSFIYKLYNEEIRAAFQSSFRIGEIEEINQGDEALHIGLSEMVKK